MGPLYAIFVPSMSGWGHVGLGSIFLIRLVNAKLSQDLFTESVWSVPWWARISLPSLSGRGHVGPGSLCRVSMDGAELC